MQLFGVGTKSTSPAITAQRRINCHVDIRKEEDRTSYALVGRPGLRLFLSSLGSQPIRGLWAAPTLTVPVMFVAIADRLYSVNNGGVVTLLGNLLTNSGDVSMADDGTYLVVVDGQFGYVYNTTTTAFTQITDGNFTASPQTVTWLDNYFIVSSGTSTRQFQLSQISPSVDPTVWPAVQIGFASSGGGKLQHAMADHGVLNLFGDVYTEFWQDTGSPDLPFAKIPGASQQFGLAAPFSIATHDNSLAGLFQDRGGALVAAKLAGFGIRKISDSDIDYLLKNAGSVSDAQGIGFVVGGHPILLLNMPSADLSLAYDGLSNVWTEYKSYGHEHFKGLKGCFFMGQQYMSDHENGNLYVFDPAIYTDNDGALSMEVWSKHIWNDDKYIGISQVQVDVQSGVGAVTDDPPVMDLQVSKDGGNTFFSVGYSSVGTTGEYTQRVKWNNLGAARDWVLKLVVTDPVKRVITGASCEMVGGPF